MNYSDLVSKVLDNQHLHAAVENLVNQGNSLNLVNHEWLSLLENDIMYQDFLSQQHNRLWKTPSSTVNYEYEELRGPHFKCIIAGHCKLTMAFKSDKQSVIVFNSEPLAKIAGAMLSDLSPNNISNEHKFNFINCGISGCGNCKHFASHFQRMGFTIKRDFQPCIADTKIYDGKGVVNRFLCQFESLFQREFMAVLNLDIHVRYSFTDPKTKQKHYRISGSILDFIGFQESKLTLNKKIDIGSLIKLEIEKPSKNNKKEYSPYDNIDNFITIDTLKEQEDTDDILIPERTENVDDFVIAEPSKRKEDDDIDNTVVKKRKPSNDFFDLEEFANPSESLLSEETCEIHETQLI